MTPQNLKSGPHLNEGESRPPIDPSTIVWDDAPAIDPSTIKWDDEAPDRSKGPLKMIEAELPDGTILEFPEGTSSEVMQRVVKQQLGIKSEQARPDPRGGSVRSQPNNLTPESIKQGLGDLAAGSVRGAGSIGATILWPYDKSLDAYHGDRGPTMSSLITGERPPSRNQERRAGIDGGLRELGANPDSAAYKTGKIAGEVAGTAGIGGALAKGAGALGASPAMVGALSSGGMNVAGRTGMRGLAMRGGGGAATGGAATSLISPDDVGLGALVGGAIPVAAKMGGGVVKGASNAIRGDIAPEVVDLAGRAKNLGIDIPADRLTDSKPLNALAASLEYMPFSGRAATTDRMTSQLNKAISRTFGQDSDNVTMALRKASGELGGEFDRVLQNNTVMVDDAFLGELAEHASRAGKELGSDGARIINTQIDEVLAKAVDGRIDGQAAYNLKRTLDRIGKRNSPEAFYALDLKKSLMGALDRSLGPDEAAAFAKTRQQYGNMLSLEKIAKNGVEGDISIGRLANMKNVRSPDLQELADISAQFLKTRESPHGALQRLVIGGTGLGAAAGTGSLPIGLGLLAAGRGANSALNSGLLRSAVLGQPMRPGTKEAIRGGLLGASRSAPALVAQ